MSAYTFNRTLPRKCGFVLTCLDNGRKRFRAVPISEDGNHSLATESAEDVAASGHVAYDNSDSRAYEPEA